MVDKLKFLFPEKYQELELADCTATLKYTDTNNIPHAEILQKDEELYKCIKENQLILFHQIVNLQSFQAKAYTDAALTITEF